MLSTKCKLKALGKPTVTFVVVVVVVVVVFFFFASAQN